MSEDNKKEPFVPANDMFAGGGIRVSGPQDLSYLITNGVAGTFKPGLRTVKGKVACTPFPDMTVKAETTDRVARIKNRISLAPLKVQLPDDDGKFNVGQTVYVPSANYTTPWAKELHTINGISFILVPAGLVELVDG